MGNTISVIGREESELVRTLQVVLKPFGRDRFCLSVVNGDATRVMGPDCGKDDKGYPLEELEVVLREAYLCSGAEIAQLIAVAESARAFSHQACSPVPI
jgi:hypothetical protein